MYGLDPRQFKQRIVEPVLMYLDVGGGATAVNLVLGTCLKESLLKFLIQKPNGPALGVGQMEPFTHNDIWKTYLPGQFVVRHRILQLLGRTIGDEMPPEAAQLMWNLKYAVAMTRVQYLRARPALPGNSPIELARYWKQHYNTVEGKGVVEEAVKHFEFAVML